MPLSKWHGNLGKHVFNTLLIFQFLGWLWDCPQVLALIILSVWTTVLTWRVLTTLKTPAILTSARTSLLLLLLLLAALLHCHSLSSRLLVTKTQLEDSQWIVRHGKAHRLELLETLQSRKGPEETSTQPEESPNPLDGCLHVFLDLGSNRGLQIRKLYEPHVFPLAPILPLYERYFGPVEERKLQEICSVAFEPNSRHAQHLRDLAASYATCGIKVCVPTECCPTPAQVLVFNHTGVGHTDTTASFAPFNTLLGHEVVMT